MSGVTDSNNQSSLYQPDAYTFQLTNTADQVEVVPGPGGTPVAVDRDSIAGIPPSQQGIARSDIFQLLSHSPVLMDPFGAQLQETNPGLTEALIKYAYTLFGMNFQTSLNRSENTHNAEEDLSFIRNALEEFEGSEGLPNTANYAAGASPKPPLNLSQTAIEKDPIDTLFEQISNLGADIGNVTEENSAILQSLNSSNPEEITQMLLNLTGIDIKKDLSPVDQKMIESQFGKLGSIIAEANEKGLPSPILNMTVSTLLTASFSVTLDINNNPSLTDDQKNLLGSLLHTTAQKISSANLQAIVTRDAPSEEFTNLTSTDSVTVQAQIQSLLKNADLSKLSESDKAQLTNLLSQLSQKMASKSFSEEMGLMLLSNDPEVIKKALTSLLGDLGQASPILAQFINTVVIPILAGEIGKINQTELNQMLKSNNAGEIGKSLGILSGTVTDSTLVGTEKKIVVDYLKVLTEALAFMAQIRSIITRLEGKFTQDIAAAKMATTSEQVKNAMNLYLLKAEEIQKKYVENADKIRQAQVMKYLMPIISILLIAVALIVLAASLVAAIPSGGVSAVAGITAFAQIIALITALSVTAVTLVYTIADTIVSWTTNKSILEHAFEDVEDATVRKGLVMGVNIAMVVVTTVLTLGIGVGTAIAISVSQGITASIKASLQIALLTLRESLKQLFSGVLAAQMIGFILSAVLSSGYIQEVLIKAFKAAGMDDQSAMILTAVMMMLVMLMTLLATSGKSIGEMFQSVKSLGQNIGTGAKEIASQISQGIKKIIEDGIQATALKMLEKIKESIKELGENLKNTFDLSYLSRSKSAIEGVASTTKAGVETILDSALTAAEKIFKRMIELVKNDPLATANFLKFLTMGLQVGANVTQAVTAAQGAEIQKDLARLERETASLEAVVDFVRQVGIIGPKATLDALGESSKEMFEQWKDLCNMVARFIMDASQRTTELHNKA